ncbi:MAG: NTP transferase domain-containing protein [Planctomycetaceae bacterium]|jgi:bifunctional UDP-N-acetylglucosamine pyrophosphorylase/glucosamine-1-phosphate N-acetyltransferase/UDP-N-acetylglucosamine pyrophosphorylase|nr:NTP transferase domain-containing protein [Planctomycetaceae bacterium]
MESNKNNSVTKIAIVMAAGKGTRMKSDLPKVLYPVSGRPMIDYVLDVLETVVERIFVVVGYRSDLVRESLQGRRKLEFVEQTEQLGTGHAVMVCRDQLVGYEGALLVLAGDCPMVQAETINKLFDAYNSTNVCPSCFKIHGAEHGSAASRSVCSGAKSIAHTGSGIFPSCVLGTATKDNPTGLGRIVRDSNDEFIGIVEERDATPEQRLIKEVNMSYYIFHAPDLLGALSELRSDNSQNEYYITDVPAVLKRQEKKVIAMPILKQIETLGINTVEEAQVVEKAMQDL